MDVLTTVLSTLKLKSSLYCRIELGAPWGMSAPASQKASFHIVDCGDCWLRLDGQTAIPLHSGDLIVMPHGAGHQLSYHPAASTVPFPMSSGNHPEGCASLRFGGDGPVTTILCGYFHLERDETHPLMALLPPLIHIKGEQGHTAEWLETTLRFLRTEAGMQRSGSELMLRHLTDMLFIQVVRAWVESQSASTTGWLGALHDPQIGRTLEVIHDRPDQSWTVATLASVAHMSRSGFSSRFRELVGEPPLQYLTRWRIHFAATTLREEDITLAQLAERVGYESEAAFSKAFKRVLGIAPGSYRRGV